MTFALTGFTKGLRPEALRDKVFVTGIYPSMIRTVGHTHAWFKGDYEAEYTWFSLGDVLPVVANSAETAARMAIRAIQGGGDPEVVIGLGLRIPVAVEGLIPGWSSEIMCPLERFLPARTNLGAAPIQGKDIHGIIADFTNRMIPERARP